MRKNNPNTNSDAKAFFKVFGQILIFTSIAILGIYHSSCKITAEGIQIIRGDYTSPEIVNFRVLESNKIEIEFSKPVNVNRSVVTKSEYDKESIEDCAPSIISANKTFESISTSFVKSASEKTIVYILEKETRLGEKYNLYSEIADGNGNSLTFCIPFKGYNNNQPVIILSEIQNVSDLTKNKNEYIELYCIKGGNLSGYDLFMAGKNIRYSFPPINIKDGEYITIHLQKLGDTCKDETGTDFALSKSFYSSATSRDLYLAGNENILGDSYDTILLENTNTNIVNDAIIFCKDSSYADKGDWTNAKMKAAANRASDSGVWKEDSSPTSAVIRSGTAKTISISRNNISQIAKDVKANTVEDGIITSSKNDWTVTKANGATPGSANKI